MHCLCCTYDGLLHLQYSAQLSLLILLFYFRIVQSHCFSVTSLHHSLMCVLFCSALSSPPPASSLGCLYLGPFVFSAVPVPPPPGVNIEEHIQIRQEEKRQRINRRHRLEEGRGMDQKQTELDRLGKGCLCLRLKVKNCTIHRYRRSETVGVG